MVFLEPSRHTILLVDDDRDFRDAFADLLRLDGHVVVEASTGEAALAQLDNIGMRRRGAPDLMVLDLMMPRMSGIELLQRLRRSARWADLPVLVVTGVNDPMLPVRLDLPIAFKTDTETLVSAVRQQLRRASSEAASISAIAAASNDAE